MATGPKKALHPEEITRLFVERVNAGDAEGAAELYASDAVMAYPPGQTTVGREAIRQVLDRMVAGGARLGLEEPLPTLMCGEIALTSTRSRDGHGTRVQVVRRQQDGSWVRILDRPEAL